MRLDYPLYGLAIVLFILTAITYVYVAEADGQLLFVVATAIMGILSVGGGIFLRPKVGASATSETTTPVQPEPLTVPAEAVQETGGLIVEAPTTQLVDAPKVETPIAVEAPPQIQVTQPVEVPMVEAIPIQGPVDEECMAPINATASTPAVAKSEFSQIRCISQKRAEQLIAIGIGTLQELANAAPDDVATKLNVSPKIVKMWIGSAKKLVK